MASVNGITSTRLSIIPSNAKRDINKCVCWSINVIYIIKGINWASVNNESIRPRAVNLSLTYKVIASY